MYGSVLQRPVVHRYERVCLGVSVGGCVWVSGRPCVPVWAYVWVCGGRVLKVSEERGGGDSLSVEDGMSDGCCWGAAEQAAAVGAKLMQSIPRRMGMSGLLKMSASVHI